MLILDGVVDFRLAVMLEFILECGVLQLLGQDRRDVHGPARADSLVQQPIQSVEQRQVTLGGRLIDPIRAMRGLPVTQNIRHVRMQTQDKAANRHEPILAPCITEVVPARIIRASRQRTLCLLISAHELQPCALTDRYSDFLHHSCVKG